MIQNDNFFNCYREIIPEFSNFQESIKTPLPNHIRVNTLKARPDWLIESLQKRGIYLEKSFKKDGHLYHAPGLTSSGNLMAYFLGHIHPQALTSCLASIALSPRENSYVLDMCAAPGGKTSHLSQLMNNTGLIAANELYPNRHIPLGHTLDRLGVLNAVITGYGYIQSGRGQGQALGVDVFAVKRFVEKPDRRTAERYLAAGSYYWNSGMFVFRADALLEAMAAHMPAWARGFDRLRKARKKDRPAVLERLFDRLEGTSIDYGVMEKAGNIRMLPCDVGWSDVGSWAALPEVRKADRAGNVTRGDVLAIDSANCVIEAGSRLVACIGCEDLVVVETPDAVLVCPVDQAQAVRKAVDALKKAKRPDKL